MEPVIPASALALTVLGFGMVITFMFLIMTRRLSPLVALTLIPIVFALLAGFGGDALGHMMMEGIKALAPTGVMLMFAILYFGIMIDVGLFDPIIRLVLRLVEGDPLKVVVGTAILAAFVSLDGDGSTTYMIVMASMLPLYRRLSINALNLTCVTILASGVMNLTPWGGPLARAAVALKVDPSDVFLPMLPVMAIGIAGVVLIAYLLGLKERQRLGVITLTVVSTVGAMAVRDPSGALLSEPAETAPPPLPRRIWINFLLTLALMVGLVSAVAPLPVLFLVGFAIALLVNFPHLGEQRERIAEHGKNVIAVVSLIFAAGIFTGILTGTGMVSAMSSSLLAVIPDSWGPYLASLTALISLPFTFFMSNDAFYFGILPIVSEAAGAYGITAAEMARASLIGQPVHLLSPLVPSTYLLVALAGVELGDHQRFTIKWAILVCLLMLAAALLGGIFPLQSL